ncbi:hypothetical protein TorRG33x02_022670 [Trema orientale]|uniref:Uncharacterized protein n=1 Tax=Trema orientale TaxID=63057 RepID=A0A2P5FW26_TREOI|nr:hypothetical protein TorRG33x02_022670 [Trema orientale]
MGAPVHNEDLTFKILPGLPESYKDIIGGVRARETLISFEELHEKLIISEALMKEEHPKSTIPSFPATANAATKPPYTPRPNNTQQNQNINLPYPNKNTNCPSHNYNPTNTYPPNRPQTPCPYLGYCQLCGQQVHTAK